jgi:hypothetical protein
MVAHIHGWDFGIRIEIRHDHKSGKDYACVYKTGGSNKYNSDELVLALYEK